MKETADSSGLKPLGMTKIKGSQWRTLRLRSGQALKVRPFKTSVNLTFSVACIACLDFSMPVSSLVQLSQDAVVVRAVREFC
jgi:hypothetical protein